MTTVTITKPEFKNAYEIDGTGTSARKQCTFWCPTVWIDKQGPELQTAKAVLDYLIGSPLVRDKEGKLIIRSACTRIEKCPKTQRLHCHLFIELKKPGRMFDPLVELFGSGNVSVITAKRDGTSAKSYSVKETPDSVGPAEYFNMQPDDVTPWVHHEGQTYDNTTAEGDQQAPKTYGDRKLAQDKSYAWAKAADEMGIDKEGKLQRKPLLPMVPYMFPVPKIIGPGTAPVSKIPARVEYEIEQKYAEDRKTAKALKGVKARREAFALLHEAEEYERKVFLAEKAIIGGQEVLKRPVLTPVKLEKPIETVSVKSRLRIVEDKMHKCDQCDTLVGEMRMSCDEHDPFMRKYTPADILGLAIPEPEILFEGAEADFKHLVSLFE